MHGSIPKDEICGIIVGHSKCTTFLLLVTPSPSEKELNLWKTDLSVCIAYYFFTDVFPPMYDGYRPLDPPGWWRRLFDGRGAVTDEQAEATHLVNGTEADRGDAEAAGRIARPEMPAAPEVPAAG